MAEPCFVLRLSVPPELVSWLDEQLTALTFGAREEFASGSRAGRAVYCDEESRLRQTAAQLGEQLSSRSPGASLDWEIAPVSTDWELEWLRHLEPVRCAGGLEVVVGQPPHGPREDTLYLEPALAFGYGEHPTTLLILEWLGSYAAQASEWKVLDVGCGTGVLSLVALRMGAASALGVDISQPAIGAARRNAERNALAGRAEFLPSPVEEVRGSYQVVCANIELNTLLELVPAMVRRLDAGGQIVLAGILVEQSEELLATLAAVGVRAHAVAVLDGWQLVVGQRG